MNLLGRTIGNYQILDEIGRGGMAVVYRGYQPSLNRYVAIKVLLPQLAFNAEFIERFQREARAVAGLRHPNIVVIYDVGQEQGSPGAPTVHYIVMEYLEGCTLKDLLEREGSLPAQRAARIVHQVAAALDYAHERGFVHRDIKPSNIFVSANDQVTLTDFGIAKVVADSDRLTHTGMLIGTPEYMSPEQARARDVNHRTDLYSLGVVLYEMLTGRVPFSGAASHAILHDVIYETPPPPRSLNPRLGPGLEAVILKAMAKSPEERFQHGREMASATWRAIGNGSARHTPTPLAQQRRGASKPFPVLPLMGGTAAALLMIIGVLLTAMARDPGATPGASGTLDTVSDNTPFSLTSVSTPMALETSDSPRTRPPAEPTTPGLATSLPPTLTPTAVDTATLMPTGTEPVAAEERPLAGTATNTSTPTATPSGTSTPWPYQPVTLMEPLPQQGIQGKFTFKWDADRQQLQPGHVYRLRIWDADGLDVEQRQKEPFLSATPEVTVNLDDLSLLADTEYSWSVEIVDQTSLDPLSKLAPSRTFIYLGPVDGQAPTAQSTP